MRKILLGFTLINLLFLWGCWDMRQIDELGLVTAVAVDKGSEPNQFSVTVQVADPSSDIMSGESRGGSDKSGGTEWTATQEGASIFDAIRKFSEISSRRIMWAHNSVIIIGEDLAKEGILPVIDFFTHSSELRLKTVVVVSKGRAKDCLGANIGMDRPSGLSFFAMENYRRLTAETVNSHLLKVSSDLKSEKTNPLIAEVSLEKALNAPQNSTNPQEERETLRFSGAAVFKKDKMLGWITPEEARGISWIKEETKNTVVTVIDPDHQNKSVSIETNGIKSKITATVVNGMPQASIRISGNGNIVEEDGTTNQDIREVKERIAALVDKKIEDEIKKSLEAIQKNYKVDVLEFSRNVHVQNDWEWENGLKDKWEDLFPQMPVEVAVDIKIRSSTLNQEPQKIK